MAVIDDFDDDEERKRRSAAGAPEFSYETIQADPWSAVYFGIPRTGDAALLRHAYDTGMQCAGAVAGPPSPALHPFAPESIGADKSREENFEHAVRRLDELDSRLRPALLDDEAARHAPQQEQPTVDDTPQWHHVENNWEMVVGNETVAKLIPISDEQFPQYQWLSLIVTADYPEHGWHAVDFATLESAQHTLEQWWDHARRGEAYRPDGPQKEPITVEAANQNERARQESTLAKEVMTPEAIARDPWNAVDLDIPKDASRELLSLVATTAYEQRGAERPGDENLPEEELFDQAGERHKEAVDALRMLDMREAAAAPEFSHETIAVDWWTAVYLPIPRDADPALLELARGVVGWVREGLELSGLPAGASAYDPFVIGSEYSRAESIEHAATRMVELDERLERARGQEQVGEKEPMTIEAIERDPRNAIDLDIPPDASRELLSLVARTADTLRENLLASGHEAELYGSVVDWSDFDRAAARYNEAWHELKTREAAEAPAQPEPMESAQLRMVDFAFGTIFDALDAERRGQTELEQSDTAKRAEEILFKQADMHSHYDIGPWEGGYAVFRTYEIDDAMLAEYGLPTGLQKLGEAETLPELHQAIIDGSALAVVPLWITDAERERETDIAAEKDHIKADVARLRELENQRDSFVIGAQNGTETHDPDEWRLQNPEDAEELERLAEQLESGRDAEPSQSRDAGDEISRPLSAADRNERVRRIIENPHLEAAERDDSVLQALEEQREELGLVEPARQDDAPQVEYSQEPEVQSSADRDAAEIDYLFGREEMTEARAAAYDRFTGQELSPRTGQTAGQVQEAGQSQSHTKGRSR